MAGKTEKIDEKWLKMSKNPAKMVENGRKTEKITRQLVKLSKFHWKWPKIAWKFNLLHEISDIRFLTVKLAIFWNFWIFSLKNAEKLHIFAEKLQFLITPLKITQKIPIFPLFSSETINFLAKKSLNLLKNRLKTSNFPIFSRKKRNFSLKTQFFQLFPVKNHKFRLFSPKSLATSSFLIVCPFMEYVKSFLLVPSVMCTVLLLFRSSFDNLDHSLTKLIASCNLFSFSFFGVLTYNFVSSANCWHCTLPGSIDDISFTKIPKSTGERTAPWGTPQMACFTLERVFPIFTLNVLFARNCLIQIKRFLFRPIFTNFSKRRSWAILSNALE